MKGRLLLVLVNTVVDNFPHVLAVYRFEPIAQDNQVIEFGFRQHFVKLRKDFHYNLG
jgi:hypothetical protein